MTPAEEKPWLPACRQVDHSWMSLEDYRNRCAALFQLPGREKARIVFMGDSITEGWCQEGQGSWKDYWQPHQALCLGVGGDQTQNLLWRIRQGEVRGLSPRVLILLIGVNNLWWGGYTPHETQQGMAAGVEALERELPKTSIVVHGLLPASRSLHDDLRQRIGLCNRLMEAWCFQKNQDAQGQREKHPIVWCDLTAAFLGPKGQIEAELMPDFVHLSAKGYRVWAKGLKKRLEHCHLLQAPTPETL